MKERHNLTLSKETWELLRKVKEIEGKSISSILEESFLMYLKKKNYNPVYFKIMLTTPPCDSKEEEELTKILDRLSDEDYVDGSEDKSIGKEENFSRDGGNKDGLNKFRRHKISFKTQKSFEENLFSGILSFLTRLIFSNSFFGKRIISVLGLSLIHI